MAKDYSENKEGHYSCNSMYAKMVREQNKKQPHYSEPGAADGEMKGEHSNPQKGP